jgi:hypothetical protein
MLFFVIILDLGKRYLWWQELRLTTIIRFFPEILPIQDVNTRLSTRISCIIIVSTWFYLVMNLQQLVWVCFRSFRHRGATQLYRNFHGSVTYNFTTSNRCCVGFSWKHSYFNCITIVRWQKYLGDLLRLIENAPSYPPFRTMVDDTVTFTPESLPVHHFQCRLDMYGSRMEALKKLKWYSYELCCF